MWLTRVYPELSHLSSNAERRAVAKIAQGRVGGPDWRIGFAMFGTWLGVFLVYHGLRVMGVPHLVTIVVGLVVFALIGLFHKHLFWNKPMHVEIRRLLNERGIRLCVHCGCNLTEPRCPECGQPFEVKGDAP